MLIKSFWGGAIILLLHMKNTEAQKLSSLTKVDITWLVEVGSEFAMHWLQSRGSASTELSFHYWVIVTFVAYFSEISYLKTWIYADMEIFSIISTPGDIIVLEPEILWRASIWSWSKWKSAAVGKFSVVSWCCILRKRKPLVGKGVRDWSFNEFFTLWYLITLWRRDNGIQKILVVIWPPCITFLIAYCTYLTSLALYHLWNNF